MSTAAAAAAALLAVTACTPQAPPRAAAPATSTGPAPTAAPARPSCGPPAAPSLLPGDEGWALRAGPFAFLGGSDPARPSTVVRPPSKVVFRVLEPFAEDYVVTGYRCADGTPLRFWYREGPFRPPGDLAATLPATPALRAGTRTGIGGYLVPTAEGTWRLDFAVAGRVRHSVVVDLRFDR